MPSVQRERAESASELSNEELQPAIDAFRRIVRALRLAEQETRARSGLSAAQLFVLRELASTPAASLTELAERTLTDRSSVAAVVVRLLEGGLVESDRSHDDRRRVTVHISAKGRTLLKTAPPAPTTLLLEGLRALPQRSRGELTSGLLALVESMGLAEGAAGFLFEDTAPPSTPNG
jgi:DNA-binding MarR family transcriptional regulator